MAADLALANYLSHSGSGADAVSLDGESRYLGGYARRGFGARYEVGLEVPWVTHSGGVLDPFIDAYHGALGLPNGGRDAARDGNLAIGLSEDGRVRSSLARPVRGPGDVALHAAVGLVSNPQQALALRARLRLPTGDAGDLRGSGGVGLAVATEFSATRLATLPLGVDARLGAMVNPGADLAPSDAPAIGFGTLALRWQPARRLSLLAQIDVHSPVYRSALRETGSWAAIGTLGGRLRVSKSLYWSLAVSEDLHTDVTPDVVIHSGLAWGSPAIAR